jgi:hypothetical protein
VRLRDRAQFDFSLGQGDVQHGLAARRALGQELQRQRGLARARIALDQVQPVPGQAPAKDIVESGNAGRDECRAGGVLWAHGGSFA